MIFMEVPFIVVFDFVYEAGYTLIIICQLYGAWAWDLVVLNNITEKFSKGRQFSGQSDAEVRQD